MYYNSWRLVPANLAWGLVFTVALFGTVFISPAFLLISPLLAFPTAGIFRMAALIARGESVAISSSFAAWRELARPALLVALALQGTVLVLAANVVLGLGMGGFAGVAYATLAAWGLAACGAFATVIWPLVADPRRETESLAAKTRTAGLMVVAFPVRMIGLALLLLLILLVSTIAYAAIMTISVAFVALVACAYVLPAADKLVPPTAGGSLDS